MPDPVQQRALAAGKKMRAAGESFQAIADYFTELGVEPKGGKVWYAASARQVLMSKMALGGRLSTADRV